MNILDHVKELVDEIYSREPNWDYPIQVYPDKIVIKDTGRFPCDYIIEIMDELFLVTADYGNPSAYSPCDTIGQVVDFILEQNMTMFTFPINDQGFVSSIVKQPNPTKSDLQKCLTILAATPQDYYARYESAIKLKIKALSKTPSPIEKTMTAYQLYQAQNPLWTINVKTTSVHEILKASFINVFKIDKYHTVNVTLTENCFLEITTN